MSNHLRILVNISSQELTVLENDKCYKRYMIATAKNGIGQIEGSECTPLGKHRISEKIGGDAPENAVFVGRRWTNELYSEKLAEAQEGRDWILTRILWLEGLEKGFNLGKYNPKFDEQNGEAFSASNSEHIVSCDTKKRYIYIHGCPDSHAMQIPSSHGCIKMRNADIIELFEMVAIDTFVTIAE